MEYNFERSFTSKKGLTMKCKDPRGQDFHWIPGSPDRSEQTEVRNKERLLFPILEGCLAKLLMGQTCIHLNILWPVAFPPTPKPF